MSIASKFEKVIKKVLPAPFTIAVLLTIFTFLLALFTTGEKGDGNYFIKILSFWESGVWNPNLLEFAIQMMLMLVLGHTLALSKPVSNTISNMVKYCNSTANAAAIITFTTLLVSLFNWGLGLIFGAIFARKVGEHAAIKKIKLNYPLIGAAGYSGMMIWHGGISGSAPIKIAETGHFLAERIGVISQSKTIFSTMNISISLVLLIILPICMYYLGKINPDETQVFIHVNIEEKANGTLIRLKTTQQFDSSQEKNLHLAKQHQSSCPVEVLTVNP